jgi:hypothetical protein
MNQSDAELFRKKTLGFLWLVGVCFFNTVPLFIISVLANLGPVSSFHLNTMNVLKLYCIVEVIRPLPRCMVQIFAVFLRFHFWCSATCHFWDLWFLLTHYHALVNEGA